MIWLVYILHTNPFIFVFSSLEHTSIAMLYLLPQYSNMGGAEINKGGDVSSCSIWPFPVNAWGDQFFHQM